MPNSLYSDSTPLAPTSSPTSSESCYADKYVTLTPTSLIIKQTPSAALGSSVIPRSSITRLIAANGGRAFPSGEPNSPVSLWGVKVWEAAALESSGPTAAG